jgi:hypothetical protein
VASVVAFVPDLLFGSNLLGALRAAGHEAVLASDLSGVDLTVVDVLVVDLTTDARERAALVQATDTGTTRTLAFYSHVEADVRTLAEDSGFDLVVPRSRMAREGSALVTRLAGGTAA